MPQEKAGRELERRVAEAYRGLGARKVEHNVNIAGNQIDIYVELEAHDHSIHRIAIDAKDYARPIGKPIVTGLVVVVESLRIARLIDDFTIVSSDGFTEDARLAAAPHGIRLVEIVDLESYANLRVDEVRNAARIEAVLSRLLTGGAQAATDDAYDIQVCDCDLDEIDEALVRGHVAEWNRRSQVNLSEQLPLLDILQVLGMTIGQSLTRAAVMIFGKAPQNLFMQAQVQCGRFSGTTFGSPMDEAIVQGPLIRQATDCEGFILRNTRRGWRIQGFQREEIFEYPLEALREALMNALVHRDYGLQSDVQIRIYDDRIEIWSPGRLPAPLTLDSLQRDHLSVRRNRIIAQCFRQVGRVEKWGSGIQRIIDSCQSAGLREPDFVENPESFVVTIWGPGEAFRYAVPETNTAYPLGPHFAHPYPMQESFAGRVREREMLTKWVSRDAHPVLAVVAMGGMGKSALAWAWVQRDLLGLPLPGSVADEPEDAARCSVPKGAAFEGVFWWSFYERDASSEAFLNDAIAYVSGGRVDPATIPSTPEKTAALVTLLQQCRMLIVLDGLERQLRAYSNMGAAYQGDAVTEDTRQDYRACADRHVAAFLRASASFPLESRVLITSRLFPRELDGLANCRREELKSLDPDDAVRFFHARGIKGGRAEIQAACEPYGYLPLALRLLAGLIVRDKRKPRDIGAAGQYRVADQLTKMEQRILQVAYDALRKTDRSLLSSIAAFRGPVAYDAVMAITPYAREDRLDEALDELIDRGLLLHHPEQSRYDLHPVVRRYAYDRLTDKKGVHTCLREYFAAIPTPDEEKIQNMEDLAPLIELYHHTVRAGGYDEARELFRKRLHDPLYFHFGAYQIEIDLLRALFPDGEDRPPRLKEGSAQGWTMNSMAISYCLSGQPRYAAPLLEAKMVINEQTGDRQSHAVGLSNLADSVQIPLGELRAAEGNLRRGIDVYREIGYEWGGIISHLELSLLLAYKGVFTDVAAELDTALATFDTQSDFQYQFLVWYYLAMLSLLQGDAHGAFNVARRARTLADKIARVHNPIERDYVRAEWLLGKALVALTAEGRDEHLAEAEIHLTEALIRCRCINLVESEPDILLSWAMWHRIKGDALQARRDAKEALEIADRCEYRLKQADIHNFLAQLDLDDGNADAAVEHATIGYERAWCDGPPYCYKPALDEATRLLNDLGASLPDLPHS